MLENDMTKAPIISKYGTEENMYEDDLQFFPDEKIPVSSKPISKTKLSPQTELKPDSMKGPIQGTNATSTFQKNATEEASSSDLSKVIERAESITTHLH